MRKIRYDVRAEFRSSLSFFHFYSASHASTPFIANTAFIRCRSSMGVSVPVGATIHSALRARRTLAQSYSLVPAGSLVLCLTMPASHIFQHWTEPNWPDASNFSIGRVERSSLLKNTFGNIITEFLSIRERNSARSIERSILNFLWYLLIEGIQWYSMLLFFSILPLREWNVWIKGMRNVTVSVSKTAMNFLNVLIFLRPELSFFLKKKKWAPS